MNKNTTVNNSILEIVCEYFNFRIKAIAVEFIGDEDPISESLESYQVIASDIMLGFKSLQDALAKFVSPGYTSYLDQYYPEFDELVKTFDLEIVCYLKNTIKSKFDDEGFKNKILNIIAETKRLLDEIKGSNVDLCSVKDGVVEKAVVSIDLYRYSNLAGAAEGTIDVIAVEKLNENIKELIYLALKKCGLVVENTLLMTIGDGALLAFDNPDDAYKFAEELHLQTKKDNIGRNPEWRKYFRVGISTGKMIFKRNIENGVLVGITIAGMVVITAVRLQSACVAGEIFICKDTFAGFINKQTHKGFYLTKVKAKEHELAIEAYRIKVVDPPHNSIIRKWILRCWIKGFRN